MLNTLRKGAAGWAAKILIGLLVLAFASWGIADMFNPSANTTLASVGDEKVTPQDFNHAMRQLQSRGRFSQEQLRSLSNLVLTNLIRESLLNAHAKELRVGISEAALYREIAKKPEFQSIVGGFSSNAFTNHLANIGQTQAAYLEAEKKNSARQQIVSVLSTKVEPPKQLLEVKNLYDNETRILSYFTIDKKSVKKPEAATEKDIEKYYNDQKYRFKAPEYRQIAYILLDAEALKDQIKISKKDIESAYKAQKKRYSTPERRQITQLSFKDMDAANKAYNKLKSGVKLIDVAKEYGQKKEDIELGFKTKKDFLDSTISDAVFSLKKNIVSKPIKGKLNTVIVKVTKIEAEKVTPLSKVEKEITDRLTLEKTVNLIPELRTKIEDQRGEGIPLEEIGKKLKLKFQKAEIDQFGQTIDKKPLPILSSSRTFLTSVFESDLEIENEPVDINQSIAWFDVTKITPERTKPLTEVKDEVSKLWLNDKYRTAIKSKAQELLDALNKGATISDLAKKNSKKLITTKALKRNETDKNITDATVRQAFSIKKGEFGMALLSDQEQRLIFKVTEINKPKALDAEKTKQLSAQLKQSISADISTQYIRGLQKEYDMQIHENAIQRVISGGGSGSSGGAPRGSY